MEYKGYSCLYYNRWHAKVSVKSLHQGRIQWANLMQGHNIKRGLRVNCGEQNHLTGLLLLLSKHSWGLKDVILQMHEAWAQKAHSDGNELCLYITNVMQTENRDVLLMRQHCRIASELSSVLASHLLRWSSSTKHIFTKLWKKGFVWHCIMCKGSIWNDKIKDPIRKYSRYDHLTLLWTFCIIWKHAE